MGCVVCGSRCGFGCLCPAPASRRVTRSTAHASFVRGIGVCGFHAGFPTLSFLPRQWVRADSTAATGGFGRNFCRHGSGLKRLCPCRTDTPPPCPALHRAASPRHHHHRRCWLRRSGAPRYAGTGHHGGVGKLHPGCEQTAILQLARRSRTRRSRRRALAGIHADACRRRPSSPHRHIRSPRLRSRHGVVPHSGQPSGPVHAGL